MQLFRRGRTDDDSSANEVNEPEPSLAEDASETDELLSKRREILRERNDLRSERDQLVRERDVLLRERDQLLGGREQLVHERDGLRGELASARDDGRRLEAELERHREHALRTSKLFLHATDYAAWMREHARRDAELALRKARSRADEIVADAQRERGHAERELLRLQALVRETRARLAQISMGALRALDTPEPEELPEALRRELTAAREQTAGTLEEHLEER